MSRENHNPMQQYLSIFFVLVLIIACAGRDTSNPYGTAPDGEALYKKYCVLCHGVDGKLGLNGSKDLTLTQLTLEERITQITKGKNTMTPFEGIMTPEEIKAVAEYSQTFKK